MVGDQASSIIVDCIKQAEDDPKAIIVRLYESLGGRARGSLRLWVHRTLTALVVVDTFYSTGVTSGDAQWVNILEERLAEASVSSSAGNLDVALDLHAFEIKTLRVIVRSS